MRYLLHSTKPASNPAYLPPLTFYTDDFFGGFAGFEEQYGFFENGFPGPCGSLTALNAPTLGASRTGSQSLGRQLRNAAEDFLDSDFSVELARF